MKSARALSTGEALAFTTRCSIIDGAVSRDPMGELTIDIPERVIDPYATVVAVEIGDG